MVEKKEKKPGEQGRIAPTHFNAKRLADVSKETQTVLCGTLIGAATAISRGELPNGEALIGFTGAFEFTDADTGKTISSAKLFLPDGMTKVVSAEVNAMRDSGARSSVTIAARVSAARDGTENGYNWEFDLITPLAMADPLADLRKHAKPAKK